MAQKGQFCCRVLAALGALFVAAAYFVPLTKWTGGVNWFYGSMTSPVEPPQAASPPVQPPKKPVFLPTKAPRPVAVASTTKKKESKKRTYPFRTGYPPEPTQEELGLRKREHRTIQLNGDPKSGTTLTETIAWLAAAMLCKHEGSTLGDAEAESVGLGGGGSCKWKTPFNTQKTQQFGIRFPGRNSEVFFTINNKHTILGTHGEKFCERGDSPLAPNGYPCNNAAFSLEAIQNCQQKCLNPEYVGGDIGTTGGIVMLVWRDIRNIVISACFAKHNGNYIPSDEKFYESHLTTCVKRIYQQFVLWARYRLLWFSNMPFKRRIVNVCYEGLIHSPKKEYKKILGALGLQATEPQLEEIIAQASPKRLKKSDNQDMAWKVRDAGQRTYRDYGLSKETVAWMDSAYANLSFDLGWNPCREEQASAAAAAGVPAFAQGLSAASAASADVPAAASAGAVTLSPTLAPAAATPAAATNAPAAVARAAAMPESSTSVAGNLGTSGVGPPAPSDPVPGTIAYQLWPKKALPGPLGMRESRFVQLNGDPKSGTTLTEMIAVLAAELMCNEATRDEAAKQSGGALCKASVNREAGKEFHFEVPERHAKVHFTISNKHTILGTHGPDECQRGEPPLDPPRDPCVYNYKTNYSLAMLKKCLTHCVDPEYHRGDFEIKQGVLLLVWRDVRNQVISTCFSEDSGNFNPTTASSRQKNLESCVKRLYPRIALWARYRQLWFSSLHFPRKITNICYERLIKEPLSEFRKVFSALGLPASDEQVQSIVEKTKPAKLKHINNVDMAKKVRDAGARDYRGYGLSESTVLWMDELYEKLSFQEGSPCH